MKKATIFSRMAAGAAALFAAVCGVGSAYVWQHTPENLRITDESGISVPFEGISARYTSGEADWPVSSEKGQSVQVEYSLWGIVPVKTVTADCVEQPLVEVGGQPFGMRMLTSGVTVVELSTVMSGGELYDPGRQAGLQVGDCIQAVDGQSITGSEEFTGYLQKGAGKPVTLTVDRGGSTLEKTITPVRSDSDGKWRCGMWIRDSTAGIGTLTFLEPDSGVFAGLGHGVCDPDSGKLLPLSQGDVLRVTISGVQKGTAGAAGELRGYFSEDTACGELLKNSETGMYGHLTGSLGTDPGESWPVAMRQQVHSGQASILVTIQGDTPQEYDIEITAVEYDESRRTKNLRIRVTDEELLEKTGGIVQGFSGSPILQDGYLAGAVTHVLVDNPCEGYGIFAETMWEESRNLQ